nr:lysylphosphatidylglycerol synthase transmembrane domain-containing protein [Streptomyces sp. DHE17-7]
MSAPKAGAGARALRTRLGTLAGVLVLGVLLWRTGTGPLLGGLRRIDGPALLAALGIGLVTTVCSAWRWSLVARGLRIRLPLAPAVADYYRALFLNAALPGGILGDVHRAVRHGQSTGDLGRGVRSVVLERAAGQLTLAVFGVAVLLTMPSPLLTGARQAAPIAAPAVLGALAVAVAVRRNRVPAPEGRRGRPTMLVEAREALLSRANLPGIALSSAVVLAGYLAMFFLAARVAGSGASVAVLTPLAVLALLAMTLPLNVGGWGPREGVTAWAFGAAGLGAGTGLGVAAVYGVLSFVAGLPGAVVLVGRWYAGQRAERSGTTAVPHPQSHPHPQPQPGPHPQPQPGPHPQPHPGPHPHPAAPHPVPGGTYPRSPPGRGGSTSVRSEKYAAKESARLASSSFPFSAEPRDGRPMTPESV